MLGDANNLSLVYYLLRQSDCSLTAQDALLAPPHTVTTLKTNYDQVLHQQALLNTTGGVFPSGCKTINQVGSLVTGARLPDGRFIAAVANGNNLDIYVANLAQTSITTHSYTLPGPPLNPIFADLNNDGIYDLVTSIPSDTSTNTPPKIAVLLGNSDGTFQTPSIYTVGPTGNVSVIDVNNDGVPDLVVAGMNFSGVSTDPTLQVLLGNGNGTFQAPIDGPANDAGGLVSTYAVVGGLFNSDANVDLATSDGHVLLGNGDGTFNLMSGTQFSQGFQSMFMVAGDFNGNGHSDLATLDINTSTVHIYLSNGDGTFTAGQQYLTLGNAFSLAASDLDGDGNLDLIVGDSGPGGFGPDSDAFPFTHFLLGRGDGTFSAAPYYPAVASSLVAGAFEGGTTEDILTTGSNSSGADELYVLHNPGNGALQPGPTSPLPSVLGSSLLATADLNGDSKLDAVMAKSQSSGSGVIGAALGNGDGTFQTPFTMSIPVSPSAIALGSVYSASTHDLVVAGENASNATTLVVLKDNGDGTFGSPQTIATLASAPNQSASVAVDDLNNDGKTDIVLSDSGDSFDTPQVPGSLQVYLGNGGGSFQAPITISVPGTTMFPGPVALGDLNNDGIPDLVFTNGVDPSISLYVALGTGNGTFGTPTAILNNLFGPTKIVIADINGDGKPDIVLNTCCGATPAYLIDGNGDGTFQTPIVMALASSGIDMVSTDLNGDGLTDLVQLQSSDGIVPFINVTGLVPPSAMAMANVDRLNQMRHAHGIIELVKLKVWNLYQRLIGRVVKWRIARARTSWKQLKMQRSRARRALLQREKSKSGLRRVLATMPGR